MIDGVTTSFARFPAAAGLRSVARGWYGSGMRHAAPAEQPSFGAKLLPHAEALYNFARYLSRDHMQAEELVQDTFARALDAETRFAPDSDAKAWLFRILRNLFLDRRRRERKNPIDFGSDLEPAESVTDAWLRGDLEIDRLRGLVQNDIESALARLSDDARTVILLDLEGFTETEIAEVIEVAVGTVKSRLSRARAVLREALQEYAK